MSGLISVNEALDLILAHRPKPTTEEVSIEAAQGRRLAHDLTALVNRPPANMSAMDGYAVRLEDVKAEVARLRIIGEVPAGRPFEGTVERGNAVRIFTGGEVPEGANHIVIQEDAERDGDTLVCRVSYDSAQFVRPAGLDFREGDSLLAEGTRLEAAELGLAAAANIGRVSVYRAPRVGILANGNELKPPGSMLSRGEITNSNPVALAALVRDWGGEPVDLGIAGDTLDDITERVSKAGDIDIFLPVGGASVGDHDLMRPAFASLGYQPVFEKIAVRPGKPTWFSTRESAVVLGLPGNPASALVCAELFLKPLITGQRHAFSQARLACPIGANGPREHFMRAFFQLDAAANLVVDPAPDQDSSLIRPFVTSAGLIRRKQNAPAGEAGALVDVVLTRPLG